MTEHTRSVAELCRDHKMTRDDLVEKTGLEETRINAILLGRWTPSPAERQRIAAVFGVSVDEITWGHVTPIQHIYGRGPG